MPRKGAERLADKEAFPASGGRGCAGEGNQEKSPVSSQQVDPASRRTAARLWLRVLVAMVAVALLASVLLWEQRQSKGRWSTLVAGSPRLGAELFRTKGCASCHAAGRTGATQAPDLAAEEKGRSRPDQLVTVMWNHAPQMW